MQRLQRPSRLTTKIVLLVLIGTGLPTLLFTSLLANRYETHLVEDYHQGLTEIGEKTVAAVAKSVWDLAPEDTQPALQTAAENPYVLRVEIRGTDDKSFASAISSAAHGTTALTSEPILKPIVYNHEQIGTLKLWPNPVPLKAQTARLWLEALVHALGVTMGTLLLTWLFVDRTLLRPLRRLQHDAQALTALKLQEPFVWLPSNEIGVIGHSLNEARERLRRSIDDLNDLVDQRTQQVVEAERHSALSMMAAGIAHEINNPMAIISSQAERLRRQVLALRSKLEQSEVAGSYKEIETIDRAADAIDATIARVTTITRSLRTYSRDGSHDPYERIDLRSIVADSEALMRQRLVLKGIRLELKLPERETWILGRTVELGQVLINLLANAIDAIEAAQSGNSWIRVEIVSAGIASSVQVRVADSGPGIPESVRDKLMTPFFTTKPVGKGTGLGLSISRTIIESHGGRLYLDSSSPTTCFVIELPLASSALAG